MHPVVIFSPINNGGAETERLQTLPQLRVVRRVSMGGRITLWGGTTRLMAGVAISHTEGRSWLPLPRRCRHRPLDCEAFRNRLSWLGPGCGPSDSAGCASWANTVNGGRNLYAARGGIVPRRPALPGGKASRPGGGPPPDPVAPPSCALRAAPAEGALLSPWPSLGSRPSAERARVRGELSCSTASSSLPRLPFRP